MFRPSLLGPYAAEPRRAKLTYPPQLLVSWGGGQLFLSVADRSGRTLSTLSMGLILVTLKPGSRSLRRSARALAVLGRVSGLLGAGYQRLGAGLVLCGPARRVLGALGALGGQGWPSVSWVPQKPLSRYKARRPRSPRRSLLARGRGLDKV